MGKEVTATKKRPKDFEALIGQDFVKQTLKNSLAKQSIANAYLFSGPRGVGKTSTARLLAKALNNPTGVSFEHLDYEGSLEIENGESTDVVEIDGASHNSVNDVKEIISDIVFMPSKFRYKIYIIDEVHMLSISAFNALLKTIEEPPEYVIFIFATTELHKVPATIKSRCQHFAFRSIPMDKIVDLLQSNCNELGILYEEDALFWIAKESSGSLRDAYTLFDQVLSFSEGDIKFAKIKEKLGLTSFEELNELIRLSLVQKDRSAAFVKLNSLLESGISLEELLSCLMEYFRDILLYTSGINDRSLFYIPSFKIEDDILKKLSFWKIECILSELFEIYKDSRITLNLRFEIELFLSKLSFLDEQITNSDVVLQIESIKQTILSSENALLEKSDKTLEEFQVAKDSSKSIPSNLNAETLIVEDNVYIYTDGGCKGNPGIGSYGFIALALPVSSNEENVVLIKEMAVFEGNTTNNAMELSACIKAITWAREKGFTKIQLTTDSMYVKDGITKWIINWKNNGWSRSENKELKNLELWQKLDSIADGVSWEWVKGHADSKQNVHVDKLVGKSMAEKQNIEKEVDFKIQTK